MVLGSRSKLNRRMPISVWEHVLGKAVDELCMTRE
jgi:hypothetical protein